MKKHYATLIILIFTHCIANAQFPGGVNTNVKAWYKANGNVNVSPTSAVNSWNNEIAGGIHLPNTKGQPQFVSSGFNFNPTVRFNGSEVIYSNPTLGGNYFSTNGNTSFIAFTSALPSATAAVMAKWQDASNSNGNRMSWEIMPSGALRYDFPSSGVGTIFSTSTIASMSYIGTMVTENNMDSISVNSTLENVKVITTNTSNITKNGVYQMGANYSTLSFPFQGNIGEIIYYNTRLPKLEQRKIESYLALKYGITLGNNANPFSYLASDGTTTAWTGSSVYQNNIAGLGRDDVSGLNQKQSKSSNMAANSIVTMALGTIASSNLANSNSFSTNKSFEVWGDNGASVLENALDLPGGILRKSQRIWRLQETGSVGTVRVRFDLSATPYAALGADYASIRLLVDADGVFASGATTILPVNYDNATNTMEFDYNFSNGNFFTFGTINTPLEIQSLSLSGRISEGFPTLFWKINNPKHVVFQVEKEVDINEWAEIATIPSSSKQTEFQWVDDEINKELTQRKYRIKQIDREGAIIYSNVVFVQKEEKTFVLLSPNPANASIKFSTSFNQNQSFAIFDIHGNFIQKGDFNGEANQQLDVSSYANGMYLIHFQTTDGVLLDCQKLFVLH